MSPVIALFALFITMLWLSAKNSRKTRGRHDILSTGMKGRPVKFHQKHGLQLAIGWLAAWCAGCYFAGTPQFANAAGPPSHHVRVKKDFDFVRAGDITVNPEYVTVVRKIDFHPLLDAALKLKSGLQEFQKTCDGVKDLKELPLFQSYPQKTTRQEAIRFCATQGGVLPEVRHTRAAKALTDLMEEKEFYTTHAGMSFRNLEVQFQNGDQARSVFYPTVCLQNSHTDWDFYLSSLDHAAWDWTYVKSPKHPLVFPCPTSHFEEGSPKPFKMHTVCMFPPRATAKLTQELAYSNCQQASAEMKAALVRTASDLSAVIPEDTIVEHFGQMSRANTKLVRLQKRDFGIGSALLLGGAALWSLLPYIASSSYSSAELQKMSKSSAIQEDQILDLQIDFDAADIPD